MKKFRYSRNLFKLFIFLILFLFFTSCVQHQIKQGRNLKIIENVPFYPQREFQCGPASLAAVLSYHGIFTSPEEVATEIFSKSAKGTLNLDMVLYAQKKGLKGIHYSGSLSDLKFHIESGYPLIVLVDYGFSFYKHYHYVVVVGYNDYGIFFNSDNSQRKFIETEDFTKIWQKTNYWTLLIKKE